MKHTNRMKAGKTAKKFKSPFGFTLAELIVVITILAILATIGFLSLSGHTSEAKGAAIKANVRSVATSVSTQSALTGNSPRYYVVHDSTASLTGTNVTIDGETIALTAGEWDAANTNYSAGNPDFAKLKLDAKKYDVAGSVIGIPTAFADYDAYKKLSVGAMDHLSSVAGTQRKRAVSYFQVSGINPATNFVTVIGNFPGTATPGSEAGLIKNPAGTGALKDGSTGASQVASQPTVPGTRYPGCDTDDVALSNGQVWAACNVGAAKAWTGSIALTNCSSSTTDCASSYRFTIGSYYQWGKNEDVTSVVTGARASTGTSSSTFGYFPVGGFNNNDWLTDASRNDNLWGGSGSTSAAGTFTSLGSQSLMKGPCSPGYHVPTVLEWGSAAYAVTGFATGTTVTDQAKRDLFTSTLMLPMAGYRGNDGKYAYQGDSTMYWASSVTGISGYAARITATQVIPAHQMYRSAGTPVRCLKD